MSEPGPINIGWWARHQITVSPDPMGREHLFAMAAAARESSRDEDLIDLFWHVLAWGVAGNFRNAARIVRAAAGEGGQAHLLSALRPGAEASYRGDIESGYRAFVDHKINHFNYAFFSKFLYFNSDRSVEEPRCLILDDRVATALRAITGKSYIPDNIRHRPAAYAEYSRDVHRWSKTYNVEPDSIEWRLYRFGQFVGTRENWLGCEVSLYRDGLTPATFDAIVARAAKRRGT
jgi:hypothetical protein